MDLHSELSEPLSTTMIADIIGVPTSDRHELIAQVHDSTAVINPAADDEAMVRSDRAAARVQDYFTQLLAERQRRPWDDLIGTGDPAPSRGRPR